MTTTPSGGDSFPHVVTDLDPHEIVACCTVDGDEGPNPAKVRIGRLYGAMLLHREHDLYVHDTTYLRDQQDMIRARLRAERFDDDDAIEWAYRRWTMWLPADPARRPYQARQDSSLCDLVVEAALAYRDTGMPADEAFGWVVRSIGAEFAVYLRSRGWSPWTFGRLLDLCNQEPLHSIEEIDRWTASTIVWWRALRYLQARVRFPEALELEDRRLNGEEIDAAIDLLLALTTPPAAGEGT